MASSLDALDAALDDDALARALAELAGAELLRIRERSAASRPSVVGSGLKDAGDTGAQAVLAAALARYRPQDVVLSEEAADPVARRTADRVWIIDPLDGTREFSEPPRADWAVHVALWSRDANDLVAGAVALPAAGLSYGTGEPPVPPARPDPDGPVRLAVSRTRPPAFVTALAREIGAELVPMGSAGVKCASVWRGETDAYLHGGGQYEWDSAAPVAVARAAGLHTSRLNGRALEYNRADPLLPDLVVCRPELRAEMLAAVARHVPEMSAR